MNEDVIKNLIKISIKLDLIALIICRMPYMNFIQSVDLLALTMMKIHNHQTPDDIDEVIAYKKILYTYVCFGLY